MPKYLVTGSYSLEGLKGVIKEGGSARMDALKQLVEANGGTLEAAYFAFGPDDYVFICDLPDNVTAAALTVAAAATGTVSPKLTVLLTPEEVDAATKKVVSYRAPGQ